jgi:hypothetical protein
MGEGKNKSEAPIAHFLTFMKPVTCDGQKLNTSCKNSLTTNSKIIIAVIKVVPGIKYLFRIHMQYDIERKKQI